ncbi:MAG TPA: hypothetical protein DHU56_07705 [Marinobacter sp.]|nr:hypothetical protein [Marinobacter sp.]
MQSAKVCQTWCMEPETPESGIFRDLILRGRGGIGQGFPRPAVNPPAGPGLQSQIAVVRLSHEALLQNRSGEPITDPDAGSRTQAETDKDDI